MRDPLLVAEHLHLGGETGQLELPVDGRERPPYDGDRGDQAGDEQQHDPRRDVGRHPPPARP
ncbi:MAG: hypothetical protein ACOYX5_15445 [Actinomycetota bacterium]